MSPKRQNRKLPHDNGNGPQRRIQHELVNSCYYNKANRVSLLLCRGALPNMPDDRGYYPLHLASQEGNVRSVKTLIAGGADVNLLDNAGEVPLFSAAGMGHVGVVTLLV